MYFVEYSVYEVLFDHFYINHDACVHVSWGTFVQRFIFDIDKIVDSSYYLYVHYCI
jgi:hypothetical protein